MADVVVDALILDLLEWLATRDRSYEEVMEAWRTSCPKLPVWEEANDRGLVEREDAGGRSVVRVSSSGRELLAQSRTSRDARRDVPARAG
jgi:hypothetical protein